MSALKTWMPWVGGALLAGHVAEVTAASASDLEFFEKRIRPIFAQHCYSCHSEAEGKVKGGLQLDWKGGWEKGGKTGPAIVPGNAEGSLLIKAVRYTDPDLQMPPKGERLSDDEVKALTQWVSIGAPDPRGAPAGPVAGKASNPKDHWAFKPIQQPSAPAVKESGWVANPIDAFVLARLEENGLPHAKPADRQTLIRRVSFDLIGLPPTPEEVDAFVADPSPDAYEKLVDSLLRNPHYGERWGRRWLDVARYSDTKGQIKRQKETSVYPYAWTYRDYVLEAFNQDKPYDQFIREQLAADRLPHDKENKSLAALGFLTLGDHFNGNDNDIINDRIDVVTKGFLGLTVTCARCHDHRFDPIPQADYYSLHGIFASSYEPSAKPLVGVTDTAGAPYQAYLRDKADLEAKMLETKASMIGSAFGDYKKLAGVYIFGTTLPEKEADAYVTKNGGDPEVLKNWQRLVRFGARRENGIFRFWGAMQRVPPARFADQARRVLANLGAAQQLPQAVHDTFRGQAPRTLGELAALYGQLFARPEAAWQSQVTTVLGEAAFNFVPNRQRMKYGVLKEQFDRLDLTHEGAPAHAMALYDVPSPKDSTILIRGEAANHGDTVPRRFLEILSPGTRPAFQQGSGRLQLAQAIASPRCPLTARVLVNRVWQGHFGEGFVSTPDDLGNQSLPPTHPELLDWLSARFMQDGWSIKKLHRLILLSNTYRQSSEPAAGVGSKDPANRWLTRFSIRRLEFEPLRDSILFAGGKLDLTIGGKPVDLSEGTRRSDRKGLVRLEKMGGTAKLSTAERRTFYGFVDREDLLEVLNTFDFANPSICSGRRYETTVPQQALFLMNSPLVVEQARNVTERPEFVALSGEDERIRFLYRLLFQRSPTAEETQAGRSFLAQWMPANDTTASPSAPVAGQFKKRPGNRQPAAAPQHKPLPKWAEYTHALMMTTEMAFVR
ncbi:MAG: PSD1 domain-containing protein [Verrucomicrobia bacterium]|nr:PSD1 domain-containing protein [Verrucomicrobiota bacterium]